MDFELRAALRALAATMNHLSAVGRLPEELASPAYQLMIACDLPVNEAPAVPRG